MASAKVSILALLCVAGTAGAALAPGDYARTLTFGGVERTFLVHVPPTYAGAPAPLVVDLHGFTSNAEQQRAVSGMVAVSDAHGFLVVHPNGLRNAWNGKLCCGNRDVDDVGFLRALVDAVAGETPVDRRRVYVTGLSNGGAMTHRLACDAADVFAAAAPMAFPLADMPATGCQPVRSIPVLTVMGLTDMLVRYDAGPFGSAPDTFRYWREVNGCGSGTPDVVTERGRSRCEIDTRCANGVAVGLCSVTAQAFPGTTVDGHILYWNDDFVLAEVAWQFFSQFRLPDDVGPTQEATLTGDGLGVVRGQRGRPSRVPLVWKVRLGQGTWVAEDRESGEILTGSWKRRGRSGVLRLTTAASPAWRAIVKRSVAALGAADLETSLSGSLRVRLGRSGVPSALRGRGTIRVGGRVVGSYTIRLRRVR